MTTTPFQHSSGPKTAKIAIVGEAWGKDEELTGLPFMGSSGTELNNLLQTAGIRRADCFITNVFNLRPQDNDITTLCASKKEVGNDYPLKNLSQGKYIKPEYLPELERLAQELNQVQPNIVVALGNTACWALLGNGGIGNLRGAVALCSGLAGCEFPRPLKVIPTFHPAAILRQWSYRPIVLADIMKASREAASPVLNRLRRELVIEPTLDEIRDWIAQHRSAPSLAVDIETYKGQIDMVGFADGALSALVIPFFYKENGKNFWPTIEEEIQAWRYVQELLANDSVKIFQNGMYDLQYFYKMKLRVRHAYEDTMLMHHSLYPELNKGLGFLGSVYTNEISWKLLNKRRGNEVSKADE